MPKYLSSPSASSLATTTEQRPLELGLVIDRSASMSGSVKRPRVMVAILTDGQENDSKRFSFEKIKELILARTRGDGWSFILIAPDSAKLALKLGIPLENCMPWVSSETEVLRLFNRLGSNLKSFRLGDRHYALRPQDKS